MEKNINGKINKNQPRLSQSKQTTNKIPITVYKTKVTTNEKVEKNKSSVVVSNPTKRDSLKNDNLRTKNTNTQSLKETKEKKIDIKTDKTIQIKEDKLDSFQNENYFAFLGESLIRTISESKTAFRNKILIKFHSFAN
jgi:hypothetical protein